MVVEDKCPGHYSKTTASLKAKYVSDSFKELLVVPSLFEPDSRTTREAHLLAQWNSERAVTIYYPQDLSSYVENELVYISHFNGVLSGGVDLEIRLEPYAL